MKRRACSVICRASKPSVTHLALHAFYQSLVNGAALLVIKAAIFAFPLLFIFNKSESAIANHWPLVLMASSFYFWHQADIAANTAKSARNALSAEKMELEQDHARQNS